MRTKKSHTGTALLLIMLIFTFFSNADAAPPLTLWVHPYLPATELVKKFTPLSEYLGKECGRPVQVQISRSYKAHMTRVGENKMDIAYLGPALYVKVTNSYGPPKILAGLEVNNKPFFHGLIITRQNSPLKDLKDLRGKNFAFGDPNSTMSFLVPRYMLAEKGIKLEDLKGHGFLDSHHNVVLSVLGGYYDAGAIKEEVFINYQDRGLKILAKSPAIAEHLFVASNNLDDATIEKIRRAMLSLKDKNILSALKKSVTGLVPVTDSAYDDLRRILNQKNTAEAK